LTKHDHFQAMLKEARQQGFRPAGVVFDSWYSGLENLKLIRSYRWIRVLRAVSEVEIGASGRVIWLEGYGLVRVLKVVATDGDVELRATNKGESP